MAVTEMLARGVLFELNTGTEAVPVWTQVRHLDKWAHAPKKGSADTTTFDDEGHPTHLVASRGDEFTMTGKYQEDPDTGARDPGQEACEAWGEETGNTSLKQFRVTTPGGNVIGPFLCSAQVTRGGGGLEDSNMWELALEVSGKLNP
jgi:hypothetical protein